MTAVASFARRVVYFGLLVALVSAVGFSAQPSAPALASPSQSSLPSPSQSSLGVFLDAPFIQGSYVTQDVLSMSFNGPTGAGQCGSGEPAGITITGACQMYSAASHGGATTLASDATPTAGGAGSNFPSTNHPTNPITISLANDSRYLGLWWPSGSSGNVLKFYKGSTLLLTVTNDDIVALLGAQGNTAQNWLDRNDDTDVLTSIGGDPETKHRKVWYFGNPRGYLSTNPTDWAGSLWTPTQPFVYIHMFAGGNLTFDKVELTGGGFEFDNLVVSTSAQTPDPRLVFVTQFTSSQYAVRFEPNGASVEGTMPNQVGTTPAALTPNTYTRSGYTFAGWATEEDGSGTRFADGASYDFTADLTLYARWTADSQPSSGGGSPALVAEERTLAATGSGQGLLLGISAAVLVLGLSLFVSSRRLRRQ